MSIAQIESEISQLTSDELRQLRQAIDAALRTKKPVATPEMLARRQEMLEKYMTGKWGADLPPWQETRALDKQKDPWNT